MADKMPSGNEPRATRSDSTASASSATSGPPVSDRELPREMPLPPPFATKVPVPSWAGGSSKEQQQNARRKSSHVLFEGLTAQKRKGDPESVARRQSFNEQRPPPGFIGQMWNSWVRGDK